MRYLTKRRWIVVLAGMAGGFAVILIGNWVDATKRGGQLPAEPFRIAGNLYYVGASDVTSFLLTGPNGHVLIDGGYPGTPPLIMASIAKLGFKISDVKILLNSHAHFDHAGGLAELQKASGAELWVSEGDADAVASGGVDNPSETFWPARLLAFVRLVSYPAPRVDHRFKDGATIRLGPIELTAHVTGGHTRGCTTWSFPVRDGDRELHVVHRCSLTLLPGMRLVEPERYPGIREDFERTFITLRSLPVDIWVTSHAREFGRWRKFSARDTAADPVAPFMDRDGYFRSLDSAETTFRELLADQQRSRQAPPARTSLISEI
jgi:metallo-beta-lactamase class B